MKNWSAVNRINAFLINWHHRLSGRDTTVVNRYQFILIDHNTPSGKQGFKPPAQKVVLETAPGNANGFNPEVFYQRGYAAGQKPGYCLVKPAGYRPGRISSQG